MLTQYFEKENIHPIIAGGLSVKLYTRENYSTYDIDLVTDGRDKLNKLLTKQLGFKKAGRNWYHSELEIAIEIPSNSLEGSEDKVIRMELENGKFINVIGIEDIIIHRLESANVSHLKNLEWSDDYGWARRMFRIHKDDENIMDKEYLMNEAEKVNLKDVIKEWMEEKGF